jgi:hypothetical protein
VIDRLAAEAQELGLYGELRFQAERRGLEVDSDDLASPD